MGVRFDDRVTGKVEAFAEHGKIIHIDVDPSELNKNKKADLPVESDIRYAIAQLNRRLDEKPLTSDYTSWHRQIDQWRHDEPLRYDAIPGRIIPQQAISRLWEKVKARGWLDRTIVTTGVGQHQMWQPSTSASTTRACGSLRAAWDRWASAYPRPWGAQLAYPDRLVIDIDGDGSFLMNVQELACVKAENLPVKVLLLNNQHLGMVVQWEDRFHGGNRAHTYLGLGDDKPPIPISSPSARGSASLRSRSPPMATSTPPSTKC